MLGRDDFSDAGGAGDEFAPVALGFDAELRVLGCDACTRLGFLRIELGL